jgi:hypothetical protein
LYQITVTIHGDIIPNDDCVHDDLPLLASRVLENFYYHNSTTNIDVLLTRFKTMSNFVLGSYHYNLTYSSIFDHIGNLARVSNLNQVSDDVLYLIYQYL